MKHDHHGRRLFDAEEKALRAQRRAGELHGCYSGVKKTGDHWHLLNDPLATFE